MQSRSRSELGQQDATSSKPTYRLIQVLRAVGALMVVVHHARIMLVERDHLAIANWVNGSSGVDLFFVISGFVMFISSRPLRSTPHPARTFLVRRLERVVPMYWLVTTAKIAVLLLIPALGVNALGSGFHMLSSYLFVPHLNSIGLFEPVVIVGWTLNFEMAFYLLYAIALGLRWPPLGLLTPVLVLLGALSFHWVPHTPLWIFFFENTLMFEFLFGIVLGLCLPRIKNLPWPVGLLFVCAGFEALFSLHPPGAYFLLRGFVWGIPATAVVMGGLILERYLGRRIPGWLLELGDASYSIYLVHTCVLPGIGMLLNRESALLRHNVIILVMIAVLFSTLGGALVYKFIELPILGWFKARRATTTSMPGLYAGFGRRP